MVSVDAVKAWLQTHHGWLLILDNADDPRVFLPSHPAGHLVITTRASDLSHVGHGLDHPLPVALFSAEQGVSFLLSRAGFLSAQTGLMGVSQEERQLAFQIVQELGAFPLALYASRSLYPEYRNDPCRVSPHLSTQRSGAAQ